MYTCKFKLNWFGYHHVYKLIVHVIAEYNSIPTLYEIAAISYETSAPISIATFENVSDAIKSAKHICEMFPIDVEVLEQTYDDNSTTDIETLKKIAEG